jgi:hypothetical protein
MKRYLITLLVVVLSASYALACDICGCGVGSYYIGILPEYNKRFIGLRYQHKTLQTHLGPQGQVTPLTTNETYQTAELWGGWNIGKKFRLLAFVPYNFAKRSSQEANASKGGLGDIAVMGYYNLFTNANTVSSKLLVHSLWVGAGIKVPTGQYEPGEKLAVQNDPNNFQLGTASTDFTLNAAYDVRLNDLGVNLNVNYKVNTENNYAYRYGNKLSTNALLYYKFRLFHKITIAPNAGVLYETAQKDVESQKYEVDVSGGYSTALVTGLELATKNFSLGANYQNVVAQQLASNRVNAGNRLMLHLSVPF